MQTALKRHRFSVDDWHRMGDTGVLSPDLRAELIEGEIFEMPPIGPLHSGHEKRLLHWFRSRVGDEILLSAQDPLRLGNFSEPQPDLMLLRIREDFYADAHPEASDVLLLVEVADTSLSDDRNVKIPLYGRYGVAETWLVNLREGCVEVYTRPNLRGYADRHLAWAGEVLTPVLLPELAVPVGEILNTASVKG